MQVELSGVRILFELLGFLLNVKFSVGVADGISQDVVWNAVFWRDD